MFDVHDRRTVFLGTAGFVGVLLVWLYSLQSEMTTIKDLRNADREKVAKLEFELELLKRKLDSTDSMVRQYIVTIPTLQAETAALKRILDDVERTVRQHSVDLHLQEHKMTEVASIRDTVTELGALITPDTMRRLDERLSDLENMNPFEMGITFLKWLKRKTSQRIELLN